MVRLNCASQGRATAFEEQLQVLQEQHDALCQKLREAAFEADAKQRQVRQPLFYVSTAVTLMLD